MGIERIKHWWYTTPLRLRSIFRRDRIELELDEELQFHLEHKIEEGVAAGLSPAEARRRALRAMGGLEQRKEEIRDTRRVHWFTDFLDDVRFALRSLRRTPALALFVVLTLALGIGMTVTPFSMLDALMFRPYPIPDPDAVVTLVSTSRDNSVDNFSYREYLDIRAQTQSYDGVVANAPLRPVGFATEPLATPRIAGGMLVSGNYFRVLGVEPALGRGFREQEDAVPGRDAVVVLGPGFWKREFASDPAVVGTAIRLNGTDFTVIGVAPESFPGMYIFGRPDIYIPLAMAASFATDPQKDFFLDRDARQLSLKGRLRAGTTLEQARNEMAGVARDFAREYPQTNRDRGASAHTFFEMRTRADDVNWKFSVIFTILALAVLLVACTNVAGLLLSRARSRSREIAVRLALGAGRFRLVRLLLTESLVLAALGGIGGIAVGYAGITFLGNFSIPTELPVTIPFRMEARVLLASMALAAVSALLCGLAPALQSTRSDLVTGLKAADVDTPGRKRLWGRNALVVAQIAASLMLLAASFLMFRSFQSTVSAGLGFSTERLLMVRFDPRLVQYDTAQTQRFYDLLADRVRLAPGVQSAALTHNPPLAMDAADAITFVPDGYQMPPDREHFSAITDTVDEGFFAALKISIVSGRGFHAADTAGSPPVAVVNQQFAQRYWPNTEAVGKRIRIDGGAGPAVEIVGVAQNVNYRASSEKPQDFVYLPLAQHPMARMVLLVQSLGDPLAMLAPVKDVVRELDANMPLLETRTYDDLYRYHAVEGPRVAIELAGTMGAVALMLAIAGLYGLVAYNVSRRTREIGIRIAVGARPLDLLRLVMGRGLVLVGIGTAIGLVMALVVERLMKSTIFDTAGIDIVAYLTVVPAMCLVTMLAAYIPARRASRIAPTLALRYE